MPIYAYRCDSCGFQKDVLQKISDAPLTQCPSCGKDAFRKQVTAAGFQLKGSGWYVTDFRGGNSGANGSGTKPAADASSTSSDGGKSDNAKPAGDNAASGASASTGTATGTTAGTTESA